MSTAEPFIRDFDVVDAAWPIERIRSYLSSSESPWVIVRQEDENERNFFALKRDKLMGAFAGRSQLGILGSEQPAIMVDIAAPLEARAAAQVVMETSAPVGIIPPAKPKRGIYLGSVSFDAGGQRGLPGFDTPSLSSEPVGDAATPLTRHLGVDLPSTLQIGDEVSMLVSLSATAPQDAHSVPLAKPAGTRIDIVVKAEGARVVGKTEGTVEISDPQLEQVIQFKLRGESAGSATVQVYAFNDGACLAKLPLSVSIVAQSAAVDPAPGHKEGIRIEAVTRLQPDLSLVIFESGNDLRFRLTSADGRFHLQDFGSVRLKSEPREYFINVFSNIERLPMGTPEQRQTAADRLAAKGASLFQALLPEALQVLLWDMRERINTVQITSDDPWVPWEMCRLTGAVNGQIEDGPFFVEAFQVTRWLAGAAVASNLRLRNMAFVVPGDSGLPQAKMEQAFLLSLANDARSVTEIAAKYDTVREQMASGGYDAWHFTGHAQGNLAGDANLSSILLSDNEELRPEDIVGRVENMLLHRPFIFLNACQSAQGGMSLTGPGGWARRFLSTRAPERTASGFIGSSWAVYDRAAVLFAQTFYTELFAGKSVGEAGKRARLAIKERRDPTWLAYTIYADPNAKVSM